MANRAVRARPRDEWAQHNGRWRPSPLSLRPKPFRNSLSTILFVLFWPGLLFHPRFEHEQFRKWRIRVRRPLAWPFLPDVKPLAAPGFALFGPATILLLRLPRTALA